MLSEIVITHLPESSDDRGFSFSLTASSIADMAIRDVHIAAVRPGYVRGNHYHAKKTELITVVYRDEWSLHWDTGPDTPVQSKAFGGRGAVSVGIPFLWSHAVRNDGQEELFLFNTTDMSFDRSMSAADQDAIVRKVV
jgi:dTDP-4-dehydrorhamnose 3,5-epimerase-like enzyme